MLQSLNHLCGLSLDSLQYVSLVLGSLELDTVLHMWPHHCGVEEKDQLSWPAGGALPNAAQEAIGLLCHKDTLLAHVQLLCCYQDSSGPLCLGSSQPVLVAGVTPPQVQDMAFPFVEMQEVPPAPFLQHVKILLNGNTTSWCTGHSSKFCIVHKLAEGKL